MVKKEDIDLNELHKEIGESCRDEFGMFDQTKVRPYLEAKNISDLEPEDLWTLYGQLVYDVKYDRRFNFGTPNKNAFGSDADAMGIGAKPTSSQSPSKWKSFAKRLLGNWIECNKSWPWP